MRRRDRVRWRPDLFAILLAPIGLVLVLASQAVDGVSVFALLQGPAALIVLGGTLGAILISHSPTAVARALAAAVTSYRREPDDADALAASIVAMAIRAHRRGVIAIEEDVEQTADPFLREGLSLAIDGVEVAELRETLATESAVRAQDDEQPARIFDAAAGYAPTLGILGAVLGLIRVMEHLSAPGALGRGVATAFIATVYGVGVANLVLLPLAGRLRERAAQHARRRELMTHGILAIRQRQHPRIVSQTLRAYAAGAPRIDEIASRLAARGLDVSRITA